MSNVKFLYEACELATFTASAGTDAAYDINNLSNRNPNSRWKSANSANGQTLQVTLPTARAVDTVIVDGHNMNTAPWVSVLDLALEYSDTGSSGWTPVASKTNEEVPSIFAYEIALLTKRYWRLRFSLDGGSFSQTPEIGNIFLGRRFETPYPYNSEVGRSEKYSTVFTRSIDSTPYAAQRLVDGIETWKSVKWSNASNDIANGFIALNTAVRGRFRPFYFIDVDGVARLVHLPADTIPITPKRFNVNDISLELEAFLANTITTI